MPGCICGNTNRPSASVTAVVIVFLLCSTAVTFAFGTAACVLSMTLPAIEPETVCDQPYAESRSEASSAGKIFLDLMVSPWIFWFPNDPVTRLNPEPKANCFFFRLCSHSFKDCQSPNPFKIYVKHMRPFFTVGKLRQIPAATSVSKDPSGRFPSIPPSMQRSNGANKLHTVSKDDNHRGSFRIRELEGPMNST